MRNSPSFWEKTATTGELCWVRSKLSGYTYDIGIVINIENYSPWNPATYQDWFYHILIDGQIIRTNSYYVEKLI